MFPTPGKQAAVKSGCTSLLSHKRRGNILPLRGVPGTTFHGAWHIPDQYLLRRRRSLTFLPCLFCRWWPSVFAARPHSSRRKQISWVSYPAGSLSITPAFAYRTPSRQIRDSPSCAAA